MIKYENKKIIEVDDWDDLVKNTYNKPYSFQQQDGCKSRGIFKISIPSKSTDDAYMHYSIPEIINGEKMGVKFKVWLERDSKQPIPNQKYDLELNLFWERNFYPCVYKVANDLYEKGLIESGDYIINIDW